MNPISEWTNTVFALCEGLRTPAPACAAPPSWGRHPQTFTQPQLFDNFASDGKLWGFLDAFHGLRDGSLRTIDMSSVQGVVSFPSFHTMLGVIITYALRDTWALLFPAILLNGTMIVATLPVGGHYLADVVAGAAVCIAGIQVLRYASGHVKTGHGAMRTDWQI